MIRHPISIALRNSNRLVGRYTLDAHFDCAKTGTVTGLYPLLCALRSLGAS